MATIQVQVEGHDQPVEVVLSFAHDKLRMSELITLEEVLGGERFDEIQKGIGVQRPSVIRAFIYAQLKTQFPDAKLDDFDFDLAALDPLLTEEEGEETGGKDKLSAVG